MRRSYVLIGPAVAVSIALAVGASTEAAAVGASGFVETLRFSVSEPQELAWSPDGTRIAIGDGSGVVHVFDAATGKPVFTLPGHTRYVSTLAFSADGRWLASGSGDTEVRLWDATSGAPVHRWSGFGDIVFHVVFDEAGDLWSASPRNRVLRWKTDGDAPAESFDVETIDALALALDPSGRRMAEGGYGDVKMTDIGKTRKWLTGFPNCAKKPKHPLCVVWVKKRMRYSGIEGLAAPGIRMMSKPNWYVHALRFSRSGRWLVGGRDDGLVFVLDARTGRPAGSLRRATAGVFTVDIAPGDKLVAAGDEDGNLWLWSWRAGKKVSTLTTGEGGTNAVAFSPDGKRLAVANGDGTVRIGTVRP